MDGTIVESDRHYRPHVFFRLAEAVNESSACLRAPSRRKIPQVLTGGGSAWSRSSPKRWNIFGRLARVCVLHFGYAAVCILLLLCCRCTAMQRVHQNLYLTQNHAASFAISLQMPVWRQARGISVAGLSTRHLPHLGAPVFYSTFQYFHTFRALPAFCNPTQSDR